MTLDNIANDKMAVNACHGKQIKGELLSHFKLTMREL